MRVLPAVIPDDVPFDVEVVPPFAVQAVVAQITQHPRAVHFGGDEVCPGRGRALALVNVGFLAAAHHAQDIADPLLFV